MWTQKKMKRKSISIKVAKMSHVSEGGVKSNSFLSGLARKDRQGEGAHIYMLENNRRIKNRLVLFGQADCFWVRASRPWFSFFVELGTAGHV